jgi:ribosomal protein S17
LASELYPFADDQPYGVGHMYITGDRFRTLQGKVVSIDRDKNAVTVKASDKTMSSTERFEGNVTLSTNENTKVTICDSRKSLDEIKIGDQVDVKYHGHSGNIVAEDISIAQC